MPIPEKETLTIEFKSDMQKISDSEIFETVVALANTDGGDIYLGVEDDGRVTGLHESHMNPVTLSAYISNNTIPPISVRTEVLSEAAPVLKISVPRCTGGIAATSSGKILRRRIRIDGTPESVPMYPPELATRLSGLRLLDYSAMPVNGASTEDFDPLEVERLRKIVLTYDGDKQLLELQNEELFKALGFAKDIEGRFVPTITGLLMIGRVNSIKEHIPTHSATFQVLEGTSVKLNEDRALPILALFDDFRAYLEAYNPEKELESGMYRMSIPDFNKRAIREGIVNAFAHRDYTKMGRVRVSITDEGLTIANPGGFVEGVTINNLLTTEPFGRNPLLADALKRVGLAEKTGRGIDRIFEGSLIYGRLLPDYTASTQITVSVFIPRCPIDTHLTKVISDEQKRLGRPLPLNTLFVLNAIRDVPRSDKNRLASITGLSDSVISIAIQNLSEAGVIKQKSGTKYILSREVYPVDLNGSRHLDSNTGSEANYIEEVRRLAFSQEFITRSDVMSRLNITESQAYRLLKKLVSEGKLISLNKGRHSKYRWRLTKLKS